MSNRACGSKSRKTDSCKTKTQKIQLKGGIEVPAYVQCGRWVLPRPTLVPFPQVGQVFTALANQPINHETVCTPLPSEQKEWKIRNCSEVEQLWYNVYTWIPIYYIYYRVLT